MKNKTSITAGLPQFTRVLTAQFTLALNLLAAALFLTRMAQPTHAQTYTLSGVWTNNTQANNIDITTGNANRGMAYCVLSNQVFVVNHSTTTIDAYNGSNGSLVGALNVSGVSGGVTYNLDQVAVADDGAIYACSLTSASGTGTGALKIYRWGSWSDASPVVAYTGDYSGGATLAGKRSGDNMAIKGSGTNTVILIPLSTTSPVPTTNMVLLSTLNGTNFNATVLAILGLPTLTGNGASYGFAFYTNNTFLFKPPGSSEYLIQYPTNFASLSGLVPATVLATISLSGNNVLISYDPVSGLLAAYGPLNNAAPAADALNLYVAPTAAGLTTVVANTTTAHTVANGNFAGTVALGGAGKTNYIYALDSDNGVVCKAINFTPAAQAPVISSQPASATGVFPPYPLSVSVIGTAPLAYQWQITNAATANFTNIPGALTNTYVVTAPLSTNYYRVVITNSAGSVTSSVVLVTTLKPVTNSAVSSLWTVAAGQSGYSYLTSSSDGTRGIAYDTNSQRVVVSSTSGLFVLNGNNGTNIETLSTAGVSFGGLIGGADQVGIADDGAVYVGNVNNAGGAFNLYRWSAPSNIVTATVAFNADPAGGNANSERWGDTMAVRGSGLNTQILLGSRAAAPGGTNVAYLTANDGVGLTYQAIIIAVSGVPAGFAGYGISFGAGNTFWAKSSGGDLFEIAFDTNTLTGTVIYDYKAGSQIPGSIVGVGVDPVNNILAGITDSDVPHDLQLFQLTGTSDSPVLFDQAFFANANANGNGNAVVTVKYPRIYGLDVDNGIVALTYGVPSTTPPTVNTPPASVTAYTNISAVTFSVGASGSVPLYYQWRFNSNNIAGATASTYVITNPPLSKAGYYDVVVHNIAGSVTSTPPALLTLIIPVTSSLITNLWSISPGTNGSYLTTSGYETRGLAYDPTMTNLFVADHSNIHVYNGTNGSYLYDLNTAGFPNGGINGWTVDQIGVAGDGTLYSCNLSADGTAFAIIAFSAGSYTPNIAYGGATGGSDLNTLDPLGDRWGDTMAVRGSGPNTQILFGSYNGTNVALFTTADGANFTPALIAVQGGVPLGFAGAGIAFGSGNTFYAKGGHNYNLREVSFDTNANTGTVIQTYTAGSQVPNDLTGLAVDITNNILSGVCYNDTPHDLQLYLLSGNTNAPYLFEQDFFPASNPNSQEDAVTILSGGLGFALDVNNGILAFTYSLPAAPAVTLTGVGYAPGNIVINWNNTFNGHGYQVQYKNTLLDPAWTNLGSPVTAASATASYTDTTATGSTRFYRVISR
jgi:hypothetical protein